MAKYRYRFRFPITDPDELRVYLEVCWGTIIPDERVCAEHSTPWRAFLDAYFAPEPIIVWEGSRGYSGKSFTMATLGICEGTALGSDVNILGGSGEQAMRVLSTMQDKWSFENAPRNMLVGEAMRITRLTNGCTIRSLMASQASVRGPHPQRLRVDEVDEVDLAILDAALGQPMTKRGAYGNEVRAGTLLSSTHQYAEGTMTEVKKRAQAQGFPYHAWCYRETLAGGKNEFGWLAHSEVEQKKRTIPAAMWETEYELQEPNPEGRAIMPEAVKAMFRKDLGVYKHNDAEVLTEANVGGKYASGADWARKQDRTAILTLRYDCKPMRFVGFQAFNRRPWPLMVEAFERRLRLYGNRGAHDGTGLGDVVDGYMKTKCESVNLVGRDRSDIFSEYIAAIERGEIVSPYFELMEGEHRYCSVDDLFGSGHPPDTFVGAALAHHAATKGRRAAFAVA